MRPRLITRFADTIHSRTRLLMLAQIGLVGAFLLYDRHADDVVRGEVASYALEPDGSGSLAISGEINHGLVVAVERALDRHRDTIGRVTLRSGGGGDVDALQIAALLNERQVEVAVEDRVLCASACVLLIERIAPLHRRIAPGAWLFVHAGSLNDFDPRRYDAQVPEVRMDAWVGRLSPAWLALLSACPGQPLRRPAGIAMTWAEIESVQAGRGHDCEGYARHDAVWLDRHVRPDLTVDE